MMNIIYPIVYRSLDSIPEETLLHFQASAEKLIEDKGAVKSLAAALAIISGSTEIKSRSLLSSQEASAHFGISQIMVVQWFPSYKTNVLQNQCFPSYKTTVLLSSSGFPLMRLLFCKISDSPFIRLLFCRVVQCFPSYKTTLLQIQCFPSYKTNILQNQYFPSYKTTVLQNQRCPSYKAIVLQNQCLRLLFCWVVQCFPSYKTTLQQNQCFPSYKTTLLQNQCFLSYKATVLQRVCGLIWEVKYKRLNANRSELVHLISWSVHFCISNLLILFRQYNNDTWSSYKLLKSFPPKHMSKNISLEGYFC